MPRPFTLTERSTVDAAHVWHLSRVEFLDVDDTWQDLADLGPDGVNTYLGATFSRGTDHNCWTATIRARLSYGTESLSPLVAASVFNRDGTNAYAPALNGGTRVRAYAKTMLPSDDEGGIDEKLMFEGRIDRPDFTKDPMTLACRDLGGKLIDTIIRQDIEYGDEDDPPTDAEVIQQILTDNADEIGELITLVDVSATPFPIKTQRSTNVSVMDAISLVASLSGKVCAYKFQADGTFKLTLYDPQRDADTPDYTLEPDTYLEVDLAALDITNVRNVIRVWYTTDAGEPTFVDVEDVDSIAIFGRRFMALGGEATAAIRTAAQATALGNYALSDLAFPQFDHEVTTTFTWFAENGDYVGFGGNNVHYDEDQALGLVNIVHEFPDGGQGAATTKLLCRGRPAGAYEKWFDLQGGPADSALLPSPEFLFVATEAGSFGGVGYDGAVWVAARANKALDELQLFAELGDGPEIPPPDTTDTTGALKLRRPEGDVGARDDYVWLARMSTRENYWKQIRGRGVKGALASPDYIPNAVQAVDPVPCPADGTIASLEVVTTDGENVVTVTPGTLDATAENYVVIIRNAAYVFMQRVGGSLDPVEFTDSGLDTFAKKYGYDAFVLSLVEDDGVITHAVSGPKFRTVVDRPTVAKPVFALGTPVAAINSGTKKVQISWTATTPGAGAVRVVKSQDQQALTTVGSGALASGTVYDTNIGPGFYRLIAYVVLSGATVAVSDWAWWPGYGVVPSLGPLAPVFTQNTPKASITAGVRVQWSFVGATSGASIVAVQRSDDNGVSDPWTDVPNATSANVAGDTLYSQDSSLVTVSTYYRLQARTLLNGVIANSPGVHYVP